MSGSALLWQLQGGAEEEVEVVRKQLFYSHGFFCAGELVISSLGPLLAFCTTALKKQRGWSDDGVLELEGTMPNLTKVFFLHTST